MGSCTFLQGHFDIYKRWKCSFRKPGHHFILKIKNILKNKIKLYFCALVNNFDIKKYILILIFSATNIQQKKKRNCVALFNSRCILVVVKDNFKQEVFNMQTEADRCLIYMHFENSGTGKIKVFLFWNYFDFIVISLICLNNFAHIYHFLKYLLFFWI